MAVSLLTQTGSRRPEDHHFTLPVVRPLPRPPMRPAPQTW